MKFAKYLKESHICEGKMKWVIQQIPQRDAMEDTSGNMINFSEHPRVLAELEEKGFDVALEAYIGKTKPIAISLYEFDDDMDNDPNQLYIYVNKFTVRYAYGYSWNYRRFPEFSIYKAIKNARNK